MRRPPPEGVEQSGEATFAQERPQADGMRRPPPEGVEQSGEATFAQEVWQATPDRLYSYLVSRT